MVIVGFGKSLQPHLAVPVRKPIYLATPFYVSALPPVLPCLVTLPPLREHPKASGAGLIMLWPICVKRPTCRQSL